MISTRRRASGNDCDCRPAFEPKCLYRSAMVAVVRPGNLADGRSYFMLGTRRHGSKSVVTLMNSVMIGLALGLVGALALPFADAVTALRQADRAGALAEADRVLFETTQATRLTRGNSQAALQTIDAVLPELDRIRAETQTRLTAALAKGTPLLPPDARARAARSMERWQATAPRHAHMLALC